LCRLFRVTACAGGTKNNQNCLVGVPTGDNNCAGGTVGTPTDNSGCAGDTIVALVARGCYALAFQAEDCRLQTAISSSLSPPAV
ncbi:MAG: hypothetical protein FWD31_06470, partial [Planctomycetaceae bacterium]|nr:hypothetical protein [Planctomycetaceae bacterium]